MSTPGRKRTVDPDAALALSKLGTLSHGEIAEQLGCTKAAIRHALARHPDYVTPTAFEAARRSAAARKQNMEALPPAIREEMVRYRGRDILCDAEHDPTHLYGQTVPFSERGSIFAPWFR